MAALDTAVFVCVFNFLISVCTISGLSDPAVFTAPSDAAITHAEVGSLSQYMSRLELEMNDLKMYITHEMAVNPALADAEVDRLQSLIFKKYNYGGHDYLMSFYQPHSAANAEVACEAMGGYLAEVDTRDEFEFLKGIIGTPIAKGIAFVIGGTDEDREGHWVNRHSGSPLGYTEWGLFGPENSHFNGLAENCQVIDYKAWRNALAMNDAVCFVNSGVLGYYFVCEVPT